MSWLLGKSKKNKLFCLVFVSNEFNSAPSKMVYIEYNNVKCILKWIFAMSREAVNELVAIVQYVLIEWILVKD